MPISKIKSSSITADAASTNLNIDANTLFLDATNNRIGIGTTNPTAKLDVRGDSESTSDMVGARIYNTNITTNSQSGIGFFNYDNFSAKIYSPRSGSPAGTIAFGTNNGNGIAESNVIERARITSTGQFLVNTTTGYGKFTVQSGAGTGKVLLDNYATVPTTENVMSIYADATNGYIQSYNNAYKNICIAHAGGNLLVGDTTTNLSGARASIMGSGGLAVQFGGATGTYMLVTPGGADGNVETEFSARSGGYPAATFKLGNSERMRITSAGNVGIGTAIPNQKLTLGSSDGTQALSFVTSAYMGDNTLIGNIEFSTFNADVASGYDNLVNIKAYKTGTNTNSGDLTFWTKSNGAVNEKLRIKNNGSIGIGRTDPAYLIDAYDVSTGVTTMRLLNTYGLVTSNAYGYSRFQGLSGGNGLFLSQNVNGINGAGSVLDSSSHTGYAFSMGENYGGWAFLKYAAAGGTVTPTVSMFLTTAGNLLVGTTALTGSTSNSRKIVGGNFSSFNGEITSALTNTYYTMFDTGADYGCFIVSVIGYAADAANYSTTAIVNIQNTSVSISYIDTGGLIFITNSGTTIRVNQNAGGTMGAIAWSALRLI